ncbi:MAG: helix-turn-helix transcriptional regulator [Ruminococcaceae bacterium]|nr:helix-turn-helix transcriptional regulator [Oscillospiraceae bacterium]
MDTIGRVICYGKTMVSANSWHCKKHVGINRLYYIYSGIGGYEHNGNKYPLRAGNLYFIPYTADFTPFCDASDPIVHTYIDFELIPPIVTNEVITMEANKNNKIASAVSVFTLGGEISNHCDLSALYDDLMFWELCKTSMIYLVNEIALTNRIQKITDEIVIKSLEIMHLRMHEKLTVNGIARECYMNPDSFIRRFSRIVGVTPRTYLKNIRLQTARCLRESGMNLSQIASETGYSDASTLSHALRSQ